MEDTRLVPLGCLKEMQRNTDFTVFGHQYDRDWAVSTMYHFCHRVSFYHDSLPLSLPFTFYVLWARKFNYQVFEVTSKRPGKLSGALPLGKYKKPVALRSRIKRSNENHCVISPDCSGMHSGSGSSPCSLRQASYLFWTLSCEETFSSFALQNSPFSN